MQVALQLVDDAGDPVAKPGQTITVTAVVVNANGDRGSGTKTHTTDADGRITLDAETQADPDTSAGNNDATAVYTLALGTAGLALPAEPSITFAWSDDASVATKLTLEHSRDITFAAAAASGVRKVVTALLTDQYGDPIANQRIEFASTDYLGVGANDPDTTNMDDDGNSDVSDAQLSDNDGLLEGTARNTFTTRRNGIATLSYTRSSDTVGVEEIWARYEIQKCGDDPGTDAVEDIMENCVSRNADIANNWSDDLNGEDDIAGNSDDGSGHLYAEPIKQYWAKEVSEQTAVAGTGMASGDLVAINTDTKQLVFVSDDESQVWWASYDEGDYFNQGGDAAGPISFEAFEEALGGVDLSREEGAALVVTNYKSGDSDLSVFTLTPQPAPAAPSTG